MKKIVHISLLILTLLIAVQPVLYFHYCQGEFQSVEMQSDTETNCCDKLPVEDGLHASSCCHNSTVALSVDDYQASSFSFDFNGASILAIVPSHMGVLSSLRVELKAAKTIPIGRLYKRSLDRLTFICIYRI